MTQKDNVRWKSAVVGKKDSQISPTSIETKHVIKYISDVTIILILQSTCENNFTIEFGVESLYWNDNGRGSRKESKSYGGQQGEPLDWRSRRTLLLRKQMLKY